MCSESIHTLKCCEPSGVMSGVLCDLPGAYVSATEGALSVPHSQHLSRTTESQFLQFCLL